MHADKNTCASYKMPRTQGSMCDKGNLIFLHDKRNIPSFKISGHCAQTKLRMLIWSLGAFIKSKVKNLTHL